MEYELRLYKPVKDEDRLNTIGSLNFDRPSDTVQVTRAVRVPVKGEYIEAPVGGLDFIRMGVYRVEAVVHPVEGISTSALYLAKQDRQKVTGVAQKPVVLARQVKQSVLENILESSETTCQTLSNE